jgi:hypothetical protein
VEEWADSAQAVLFHFLIRFFLNDAGRRWLRFFFFRSFYAGWGEDDAITFKQLI